MTFKRSIVVALFTLLGPHANAQTLDGVTIGSANPNSVSATAFNAYTTAYGSTTGIQGGCTSWQTEGHANWNVVQTCIKGNPTEFQVYSNAYQGIAQSVPGSNEIAIYTSGTASSYADRFSSSWVGKTNLWFDGVQYQVASFIDAQHITVSYPGGGTVTFGTTTDTAAWYYATTSVDATVNVSGTNVTYISGQPFIPFFNTITINGTTVSATFVSPTQLTLGSSLGALTNAALHQEVNIANELSNVRTQALAGSSEENFVVTETPSGPVIQTAYDGYGKYRPIIIRNGESPAGTASGAIGIYPGATLGAPSMVTLGGILGNYAIAVNAASNTAPWTNFFVLQGNTSGGMPNLASRGGDTSIGMNFDLQGAATYYFTSHSFGKNEFQIFGSGGTCSTGVNSTASTNQILSEGSTTCNLQLVPGSSGKVYTSAALGTGSSTVSGLASFDPSPTMGDRAFVTDATSCSFNTPVGSTGGGSIKCPVVYNGTVWVAG
jgi:hypothetical protein